MQSHLPEANKITENLAFDPLAGPVQLSVLDQLLHPLKLSPLLSIVFVTDRVFSSVITCSCRKPHGVPVSIRSLRRSPHLGSLADGFKPAPADCTLKLGAPQLTLFKKSCSKLKSLKPVELKPCLLTWLLSLITSLI